ncbi:MAG: hypothetical protein A2W76_07410 [Gammaproteobacteria bacterium RIFCSPLOWO2_12_47_11]|nr:MAG: hypothetical protein A2W76_07410 [Gammaproteobacteria bacterium RIFCSPLOWO2_12_47_11]
MLTIRKFIARRSWLMATVVIALLIQVQQTLACDVIIDTPMPASEHCYKHDAGEKPADKSTSPCCDFSTALSMKTSHCHDGQETTFNLNLLGKLNPDTQPVFIITSPQDVFFSSYLTALLYIPDRKSSRLGTHTYLSTQRLRI